MTLIILIYLYNLLIGLYRRGTQEQAGWRPLELSPQGGYLPILTKLTVYVNGEFPG